ncbi:MAG: Flp pilus assembly protein CpaB [Pseudomonadota bacterium]
MRLIGILVLIVGIGLAGGSLYYANQVFSKFQQQRVTETVPQETGPATVPVIVAASRVEYGAPIVEDMIRVIDWPANSVPDGAFASPEDLVGDIMQERRVALRPMEVGEPILQAKVSGFGEDSRMAMLLQEGRRAFSLPIDALSGVAGFIGPGDRVDILLTENQGGGLISRVVLADVLVIAVDQRQESTTGVGPRLGSTATLDVSAREAQKLNLAQQIGRLSMTLRGAGDVAKEGEEGSVIGLDDLRGVERQEAGPAVQRTTVRVRRGTGGTQTITID